MQTQTEGPLRRLKSCGFLIFRKVPELSFLLIRDRDRLDLPKGHIKTGETEMECAFREVFEETGISQSQLLVEHGFRYTEIYYPRYKRFGGEQVEKTLVIFLAVLEGDVTIQPEEHFSFEWVKWNPPHKIQKKTIDPLLRQVAQFWSMTTEFYPNGRF